MGCFPRPGVVSAVLSRRGGAGIAADPFVVVGSCAGVEGVQDAAAGEPAADRAEQLVGHQGGGGFIAPHPARDGHDRGSGAARADDGGGDVFRVDEIQIGKFRLVFLARSTTTQ